MKFETLKVSSENQVLTVELNRPDCRNAFNDQLISELQAVFEGVEKDSKTRVVVLQGTGKVFCAGGDLNWMQASINMNEKENLADTKKLSKMFATLNSCSKPVVGLVQGAAIGGGVGLVSICDYVVASQEAVFSLAEVRLGIIPACIGPFVLAKIGESHARAFFISAERFSAERAYQVGLVHELVAEPGQLIQSKNRIIGNLLQCGPNAMAEAKALVGKLKTLNFAEAQEHVATTLSRIRVTPEGQEGLKAFLEKRKPKWTL